MFVCSSDCYDRSANRDIVETCVKGCNKPVKNATGILQKELDDLQVITLLTKSANLGRHVL